MRKKLDTRFPAARIKKIMQTDEDVGKIALAVPVLVSKALELFLQDLCDRTYEITLQRGAKTMNALHLKHCVQSYNVFDFLREIVSRVPDYTHGHSDVAGDDRAMPKRRKATGEECNDSDEDAKRSKMHETTTPTGSSGRGKGRGRGRGRGRAAKNTEKESSHCDVESDPGTALQHDDKIASNPGAVTENGTESKEVVKENIPVGDNSVNPGVRNFDLNAEVDESPDTKPTNKATSSVPTTDINKHEEFPGWSLSEMDKMQIDPIQLANLSKTIDEDEEDYDEEEG